MTAPTTPFTLKTSLRQGIFYVAMFAGTGASLPFLPLWLKVNGMSSEQIGLILASPLLLRSVSGPISGVWADRFRLYRTPLIYLAILGTVFYALLGLGNLFTGWRFWIYLCFYTAGYTCMTSLSPLLDSMTLQLARREGFTYAIPRALGSASFIFANIVVGFLLLRGGSDCILIWIVLSGLVAAFVARVYLPEVLRPEIAPRAHAKASQELAKETARQTGLQRIFELARNKDFVWLLLATGCLQGAHSFYYAFSTIIWKSRGVSSRTCGYLWATGVVAEIVFMAFGDRLRRKLGPWRMLLLASAVSVIRWASMMMSPPVWWLYGLQLTHAFSFAATYLAGLELVHRLVPREDEALGQTLSAAFANGVVMGIGTLASGTIYQSLGDRGYALMAVLAFLGFGCALRLYCRRSIP